MSQENNTGLKMPKPLAEPCRHLENENIPQDRLEARLNGTESNWAAAQGQGNPETDRPAETSSKTKTSEPESEPETPSADAKAEKEPPSETRREETKPEETPEKRESPSAETTAKEKTSMPENPEKDPTEPQKETDTKAETTDTMTGSTETKIMKTTTTETSTTPETGTTPQRRERRPSRTSEESESSQNTSESKDPNTYSRTNSSPENLPLTAEYHSLAKEKKLELENTLLRDSLVSLKEECNNLVREQTEKVETLRGEISETTAKLEGEMKELRQGLVTTMQAYSDCLSMKTNGIHSRIEESLDKLEMNSKWIREGTGQLIAEDRAMICEIPTAVEKELTRAANETSDYVDKALEKTVTHYTDEIKKSTKFLKKQVEERKKASRFEKVTDVLMRVCCPIFAAGTFILACVVTCLL